MATLIAGRRCKMNLAPQSHNSRVLPRTKHKSCRHCIAYFLLQKLGCCASTQPWPLCITIPYFSTQVHAGAARQML